MLQRTISKTVKIDKQVHINLDEFLNQLTYLYNCALQERIEAYKKHGKSISYENQASSLTDIRKDSLLSEFGKFNCQVQQDTLKRLARAYERFFKFKKGFPRYKQRTIRSFEFYTWSKPKKIGRRTCLKIKGLGRFSFKGSMPEGVKFIRVVKTAVRVKLQFIREVENTKKRPLDNSAGMDSGITSRLALSDGTLIRGIKLNRKELKRKQRVVSRSEKGSNNRQKKELSLSKEWERTTDCETNAMHRLTTEIVKKSNNTAMEDLKIPNMVKNSYLSGSITEQQWEKIKSQLAYKAESAGGKLTLHTPHYTTRTCSECGKVNPELSLYQRVFNCIYCGYSEDRDINAGRNVNTLNEGNPVVLNDNTDFMSGGNKIDNYQFPMSAKSIKIRRDRGQRDSALRTV